LKARISEHFAACKRWWVVLVPCLLLHLAVTTIMIRDQFVVVGGRTHVLLFDDAFISMVFARNLVETGHLHWSGGVAVEGYSNLLWVLVMSVIHLLPLPARLMAAPVLFLNAALVLVAAMIAGMLARSIAVASDGQGPRQPVADAAPVAATIIVLLDFAFNYWSCQGFESTLTACLIGAGMLAAGSRSSPGRAGFACGAMLSFAGLCRAEMGFFLVAFLGAAAVASRGLRGVLLRATATVAATMMLLTLWRLWVYGSPLPNTYYLKVTGFPERFAGGVRYTGAWLTHWSVLAYLVAAILLAGRSVWARLIAGLVAAFAAFAVYLGGDAFPYFRLLLPMTPLVAALGAAGLGEMLRGTEKEGRAPACVVFGFVAALTLAPSIRGISVVAADWWRAESPVPTKRLLENLETIAWLNGRLQPGDSVGVFYAGVSAYFIDAPVIDMLGKCEPHIARQRARGGKVPGHNKFDFKYVAEDLRPVYILGERLPPAPTEKFRGNKGDYAFADALAFSPEIAREYVPLREAFPSGLRRAIYLRRDRLPAGPPAP